jgi:osmotically inducible lipoprotein OsmB
MTRPILPLAVLAAIALSGCTNMTSTEQRTLSGGAIGASVGAVGTAITGGCVACGAALGGAVGAAGGYVYDQMEKDKSK